VQIVIVGLAIVLGSHNCRADDRAAASRSAGGQGAQAAALRWIDKFSKNQVLFSPEDVARLRKKVAEYNPEEAAAWLERTQEVRDALDNIEWKETNLWLSEFLRVQAIYSDEQLAEFRAEAKQTAQESPEKFQELLAEIEQARRKLARGARTDADKRRQQLDLVDAYRQEQVAAREAARKSAAERPAPSTANPAPAPRPKEYREVRPLIESMDAARWTIMQSFWRNQ
jgi:hypothetical protein